MMRVSNQAGLGVYSILADVRLQEGESLENALRRFKRKVQQEDIIKEVKRHSFYLKPGEKKRVKAALARKRARKKVRKEQDYDLRLEVEVEIGIMKSSKGSPLPGAALLNLAPTRQSCSRDSSSFIVHSHSAFK